MNGSDQRLTVPQVARLLGISERGVRDKIEHGHLRAEKEGKRWIVLFPADDAVVRGSVSGSDAVVENHGSQATSAEVERAIARTGQQYTADLGTMLAELREVFAGQVAAQQETIAAQADTIAELRRRAEVAEAALAAASAAPAAPPPASAAPLPPHEAVTPNAATDTPDAPEPLQGFWQRVRRVFGGGEGRG